MNDIRGLSSKDIIIDDDIEIDYTTFQIIVNGFAPVVENSNIDEEE